VYNVLCDKLAQIEWETGNTALPDPQVTPQEKWALFSSYPESHKVIGDLGNDGTLSTYRHDLSNAKIGKINLYALHTLLQHLSIHK